MRKQLTSRILSVILALAMILSVCIVGPATVSAAEQEDGLIYSLGQALENSQANLPEGITSELTDYAIAIRFKTPSVFEADAKILDFGDNSVRYMYFTPYNSNGLPEFALSNNGNGKVQSLVADKALEADTWYSLIITQRSQYSKMYINGIEAAQLNETIINPSDLGVIESNVVKGTVDQLKFYNKYLDADEAASKAIMGLSDAEAVALIKGMLSIDATTTQKISLPVINSDITLSWKSSNPDIISNDGWVTRPQENTEVTLTATITKGDVSDTATFTTVVSSQKDISTEFSLDFSQEGPELKDTLFGIFFEDINWGADAGLYPEKFTNRSFEYFAHIWNGTHPSPNSAHNRTTDEAAHRHGWLEVGDAQFEVITDENCMNKNNTYYAKLDVNEPNGGILNYGYGDIEGTVKKGNENCFPGMNFEKGETYTFSMWVRGAVDTTATITIYGGGSSEAEGMYNGAYEVGKATLDINTTGDGWQKVSVPVTIEKDVADESGLTADGFADITFADPGTYYLDFISLYPVETYNNRENGLNKDLVEKLREMEPGFMRFPGGCVSEGVGPDNRYNWKKTVGPIEERKLDWNLWCENLYSGGESNTYYYQSFGLGYYEYMLLCEDLGCAAMPVMNAGIACELRETGTYGESLYAGGIDPYNVNVSGLQPFIDDAIDFIEFCLEDPETNEWAAIRAEMGHPEPFDLEYLAIGNEQENYGAYLAYYDIFEAQIHAVYPQIKLITSSGRSTSGTGYQRTYDWLLKGVDFSPEVKDRDFAYAVDEHGYYYNEAQMYQAYDRYNPDVPNYVRGDRPYVFFGEYSLKIQPNTVRNALAEAALMAGFEKNADIVAMASYAPLFAKDGFEQWTPDAIWFSDYTVYGSPAYYNQKMYSIHKGDYYIPNEITYSPVIDPDAPIVYPEGTVGLGSWADSVAYDEFKVIDNETGDVIAYYDFEDPAQLEDFETFGNAGTWIIEDGLLKQTDTSKDNCHIVLKDGYNWSNYTVEVKAIKYEGAEGFIMPILTNGSRDYYWFNYGGWTNTQHAIERGTSLSRRSQLVTKAGSVENNVWYDLKVTVDDKNINCYVDNESLFTGKIPTTSVDATDRPYSSASYDKEANEIIIRAINPLCETMDARFTLENVDYVNPVGRVIELGGLTDKDGKPTKTVTNSLTEQRNVYDKEFTFDGFAKEFYYTMKPYSSLVFRISLDNDAEKISYVPPVSMTTVKGVVPTLPEQIPVVYADGHEGLADVTWDYKPDEFYNVAGQFDIIGNVNGTDYDATLVLTIEEGAPVVSDKVIVNGKDDGSAVVNVNDNIVISFMRPAGADMMLIYNEYGNRVSVRSQSVVDNGDGTETWTVITAVGTKGNRTLSIFELRDGDIVDTGLVAPVTIVNEPAIIVPAAEIISVKAAGSGVAMVNKQFYVDVVTNYGTTKLSITNEYGLDMGYSIVDKVDNGDGTISWKLALSVGSKGVRTLSVKAGNADGWSEAADFRVVIIK